MVRGSLHAAAALAVVTALRGRVPFRCHVGSVVRTSLQHDGQSHDHACRTATRRLRPQPQPQPPPKGPGAVRSRGEGRAGMPRQPLSPTAPVGWVWGWGGVMYIAGGRAVAFSLLLEDLRRRGAADLWVSLEDSHHGLERRGALEDVEAAGPLLRRAGRAGSGGGQGLGPCRPPRERQGDGEGAAKGGRGEVMGRVPCRRLPSISSRGAAAADAARRCHSWRSPPARRAAPAPPSSRHSCSPPAPRTVGVGGRVTGGLLGLRGSRRAGSPS